MGIIPRKYDVIHIRRKNTLNNISVQNQRDDFTKSQRYVFLPYIEGTTDNITKDKNSCYH